MKTFKVIRQIVLFCKIKRGWRVVKKVLPHAIIP